MVWLYFRVNFDWVLLYFRRLRIFWITIPNFGLNLFCSKFQILVFSCVIVGVSCFDIGDLWICMGMVSNCILACWLVFWALMKLILFEIIFELDFDEHLIQCLNSLCVGYRLFWWIVVLEYLILNLGVSNLCFLVFWVLILPDWWRTETV